jgi:hypothetical protein
VLAAQPDIIRILQQLFVVGADVQHDRETQPRVHAGAGRIERELADRDAHAVGAEIAQAENALAVGDDDEFGRIGPIGQQLGDAAAIVGADEKPARPLENIAELLTGESHRRRVNDRLNLVDIVADEAEKQRLVAVVERIERHVFFEVVGQIAQIGQQAIHLCLDLEVGRRQQAAQAEGVAFLIGEAGPFVQQRIAQQSNAARRLGGGRTTAPLGTCFHTDSPAKSVIE